MEFLTIASEKYPDFDKSQLQEALVSQLEKDLGYEVDVKVADQGFLENIYKELVRIVTYLEERDAKKLSIILYRVDVSESKIEQALQQNDTTRNFSEIVSQFVLEREMQKVFFRFQYKA